MTERGIAVNHGEGSATLVLESREHAERRGCRGYGQVLSTAVTRSGLPHPLASDDTGGGLVSAVRTCLADQWHVDEIPYVHGGNDGGPATVESNAIRQLYGTAASQPAHVLAGGVFRPQRSAGRRARRGADTAHDGAPGRYARPPTASSPIPICRSTRCRAPRPVRSTSTTGSRSATRSAACSPPSSSAARDAT